MISWSGLPAECDFAQLFAAESSGRRDIAAGRVGGTLLAIVGAACIVARAHAADEEQIKLLMDTNVCAECDLSKADLSGRDLAGSDMTDSNASGIDLSSADLSGAKLIGVNFRSGNLAKAALAEAKLMRSNLEGANLSGADLRGATLTHAALGGAALNGVNLSGAKLHKSAGLKQEQLETACGDDATSLPEGLSVEACADPEQNEPEVSPAQ